jgi:hypothetical protein
MKGIEKLEKRAREKLARADIFITNAGVISCPQHPFAIPLHDVAKDYILPRPGMDPRQFPELQYDRT